MAIIGLDSAPPALVFERWRDQLPTLGSLMRHGAWGRLRSCHPPITVPAWSSMLSGRDPGELGIYGFRDRRSREYGDTRIASARSVQHPRVWDLLGDRCRTVLVGVPQTYPPPPINGAVVSCFLTPSTAKATTHPAELRREIELLCGRYAHDIEGFRQVQREVVVERARRKTQQDFAVARHLLASRPWELFLLVLMGTDRIQHACWPATDDDAEGWQILLDYYRELDAGIASLLERLGSETAVLIVSDHGAKRMEGGLFLNQWLIANGYLVLHEAPVAQVPLTADRIDWRRTVAWSDGGYCGRIYLNVAGREPRGTVPANRVESLLGELAEGLAAIPRPDGGGAIGITAHRPSDLYRRVEGIPPDLLVYLGDLSWRALGSVGPAGLYGSANDTGPDGANHDWDGILIANDPCASYGGRELIGLGLGDIAPSVLSYFDYATAAPAGSLRFPRQ